MNSFRLRRFSVMREEIVTGSEADAQKWLTVFGEQPASNIIKKKTEGLSKYMIAKIMSLD